MCAHSPDRIHITCVVAVGLAITVELDSVAHHQRWRRMRSRQQRLHCAECQCGNIYRRNNNIGRILRHARGTRVVVTFA